MNIIFLVIVIIAIILALFILGLFFYIKGKLSNLSNEVFGTPNIIEGFKKQELELSETPKSVSSMDSVLIPKILNDFPYLDINEMKSMAESALINYFKSLEDKKLKSIDNISDKLLIKIEKEINNLNELKSIKNMNIHRTVITSYENKKGSCIITFQSSLEYILKTEKETKKIQTRYNTSMIYIYDDSQVKDEYGVSLNCKNCGAPIKKLGIKTCPYCGTGIVDYAKKTWKIDDIYEK